MIKQNEGINSSFLFVDDLPPAFSFEVPEDGSMKLNIAFFKIQGDCSINIKVGNHASFDGCLADFSNGKSHFILNVDLQGVSSNCVWHAASLSRKDDDKRFETSVCHHGLESTAFMYNYGICREASKLVFTGVSEIIHGARKSKTRQEAKIIVFDPLGDGQASPILKIGDNDVEASHAAVVGRLNEEHLFYLESRGVSEDQAKRLITLGYLKPIERYFSDGGLVKRIDDAIEGGV
jgi:Fe-S cluster assembly protein SufD